MLKSIDIDLIRTNLSDFNFKKLFIESLGWNNPDQEEGSVKVNDENISYKMISELSGVFVLEFDTFNVDKKLLHKKIKEKYYKHICIFRKENACSWSYLSKDNEVRNHDYFTGQNEDLFISKLAYLRFGIEDEPKILDVAEKLEKAFDNGPVTKDFFNDFRENIFDFQKYISGITNKEDKKWYASAILNRLMFIWFLQKKGFLDNHDYNYLENKLQKNQDEGKNYYSGFLQILFFEGFSKKPRDRSEKAKEQLGDIKYLNGGLFSQHQIEEKYGTKIKIKNIAFEKTFKIFNKYDWHKQDNKGNNSQISPDVLGYIFEKYINEMQRKSMGAYYTKDQITSYLSKSTIQKSILNKINKEGYGFQSTEEVLHKLDSNLCKLLLTNDKSILNTLTVLDPAVGSGAFLVSAMKELINMYSPIIKKIETLVDEGLVDRDLKKWYQNFKKEYKSTPYGIKRKIILNNLYGVDLMKEATEVCKLRLFLSLVSAAEDKEELEPLPNIDFNIMHGNSLVGFLKHNDEQQLDFAGVSYSQKMEKYNKLVLKYKHNKMSFNDMRELRKKISEFSQENEDAFSEVIKKKCNSEGLKHKDLDGRERSIFLEDIKSLTPFHWDFSFNKDIKRGGFDIILTNPPWDKVKIEDKEFFKKYDNSISKKTMTTGELKKKKKVLLKKQDISKDYDERKNEHVFVQEYFSKFYNYQTGEIINSKGNKKNSSADMDYYRLFTERSFELLNDTGVMGIVLPTGLCKDDGAVGLRNMIFEKTKIEGLIDFQNQGNNGKIFEGVHPSFKFLLLNLSKGEPSDEFFAQFQEKDLNFLSDFPEKAMKRSIKKIKKLSPNDHQILEFTDPQDRKVLNRSSGFPTLSEQVEDKWNIKIYREFDKTNDSNLFKDERLKDSLPLYQGKAIYQYTFNKDLSAVNEYVNTQEDKVKKSKGFAFKNKCYKDYRLVIRTIASNTNERTLISAVIPKNNFIVHSLHGVHIESSNPEQNKKYMLVLQAFFNSFIVDFFIRQRVSSNVNKKDITPLRIPRLTEKDNDFKQLVEKSALLTCIDKKFDQLAEDIGIRKGGEKDQEKRYQIQGEIDAIVAHIYELELDEFEYVLGTFKKGNNQTRLKAIKKYALKSFDKHYSEVA